MLSARTGKTWLKMLAKLAVPRGTEAKSNA
jgi:hypothetical protein